MGVSLVGVYLYKSLSTPSVARSATPPPGATSSEPRATPSAARGTSDPPSTRNACAFRTFGVGGVGKFAKQTPRCHWTLRGHTATKVSGARLRHKAFIFLPLVSIEGCHRLRPPFSPAKTTKMADSVTSWQPFYVRRRWLTLRLKFKGQLPLYTKWRSKTSGSKVTYVTSHVGRAAVNPEAPYSRD